jgi:hypothetical protein
MPTIKRTTVSIDTGLLDQAKQITGNTEVSSVLNEGLRSIIRVDAAQRLIALGGTMPDLHVPDRERPPG